MQVERWVLSVITQCYPDESLILCLGYKHFGDEGGGTIDPFVGVRFGYWPYEIEREPPFDIAKIGSGYLQLFPVLGLYLGYTW